MNENKEPKDCLKCHRRGTDKCAFLNRDYNAKCDCLWVRSERRRLDNIEPLIDITGPNPIMDELRRLLFPPMDYNRNATSAIAENFDPNLN